MTRDEFTTLPPIIALGLVYDMAQAKLEPMPRPHIDRSPKYDDRFPKKKGFYVWVSEMTLDDLQWWRAKKAESAASGGEWAEKDAKWVAKLDKWIAWRRLFPSDVWSGTRGEDRATAAPPSREPRLNAWDSSPKKPGSRDSSYPSADTGRGEEQTDDDLAFISNVTNEPAERWWKRT
jgi:hypothetical protein